MIDVMDELSREDLAEKINTYYDICREIDNLEISIAAESHREKRRELFTLLTTLIFTRCQLREELLPRSQVRRRPREVVCAIL